jgi:hypothetical protein
MSDEPQSESNRNGLKSGLSIAGALAAVVSIWWFALRPRRKGDEVED